MAYRAPLIYNTAAYVSSLDGSADNAALSLPKSLERPGVGTIRGFQN